MNASPADLEQAIKTSPWLQQYCASMPRRFLAKMELIDFGPEKKIIVKGEKNPYIYIMYNGSLRIINEFDNDRIFAYAIKETPGFSGLLELLSGQEKATSTVITARESHFIRMNKSAFTQWMEEDILAYRLVVKTFANQLYPAFFSMGSAYVYPKYYVLLQFLFRTYGQEATRNGSVIVPLTRERLGEELGLSLRTIYRLCTRLQAEKFGTIVKKKITFTSQEAKQMQIYLESHSYEQIP
ncbi:Crp/Fnr family transcriptional regulator [uncultured Sphaerochaeta sp.]|uniref:Crp/Fnr family transcriptional regulator n=1 Tax=uncultured Sphaerochaeta sp. TaxID=886478 RepID=UPI002A0A6588|nr:Crp/Fnr family transcriptional regulator [uncultured Sphaerochaeta sp.]